MRQNLSHTVWECKYVLLMDDMLKYLLGEPLKKTAAPSSCGMMDKNIFLCRKRPGERMPRSVKFMDETFRFIGLNLEWIRNRLAEN